MRNLNRRVEKLETCDNANVPICRMKIFNDTRENVERQIADEEAAAKADGETLMAVIFVPHKGESKNDFRKASGLCPLDIPGWDVPVNDQTEEKNG